jgi:hypothetical protein
VYRVVYPCLSSALRDLKESHSSSHSPEDHSYTIPMTSRYNESQTSGSGVTKETPRIRSKTRKNLTRLKVCSFEGGDDDDGPRRLDERAGVLLEVVQGLAIARRTELGLEMEAELEGEVRG